MRYLEYTDADYSVLEKIIDHDRDHTYVYGALRQLTLKYAIRDQVDNKSLESPQFTFMRMAMDLAEDSKPYNKRHDVTSWYNHFSLGRINCPTPNYTNLGTPLKGLSSCCVYTANDNARSLAVGDHIAYTMTYMSAGIGSYLNIRSLGDPVRNGAILHQGKLPYYQALAGAVTAQLQNGRGGACTTYYSLYDPEAPTIMRLKNAKSVEDKRNRKLDYAFSINKFFARKAAMSEDIFTFNVFTAPTLHKALFSLSDTEEVEFIREYNRLLKDPSFEKNFVSARELLIDALNEASEVGRHYEFYPTEVNNHTPFLDEIVSSNLCTEIMLPTKAYSNMMDLYSTDAHHNGEVAMCNLAALCPSNIDSEETYADAAYYALLMIDRCIHKTHYELPHVGVTTKARMNAGVGILGLAHTLASKKLKYSSLEGKREIDCIAESHYWHLLNASLRLGQELGNAPWMHKTKWPEGYLPQDTANLAIQEVLGLRDKPYNYNWELLHKKILINKGIRNSVLVAHMPTESSSKAVGLPNGVYPIREMALSKSDKKVLIEWVAQDGEDLEQYYEMAWDISAEDYTHVYAILQSWCDQGISADYYRKLIGDTTLSSTELLSEVFQRIKFGLKSRYYFNSQTSSGVELNSGDDVECIGSCTL